MTVIVFNNDLLTGRGTPHDYGLALAVMTLLMAVFYVLQERRRPVRPTEREDGRLTTRAEVSALSALWALPDGWLAACVSVPRYPF